MQTFQIARVFQKTSGKLMFLQLIIYQPSKYLYSLIHTYTATINYACLKMSFPKAIINGKGIINLIEAFVQIE